MYSEPISYLITGILLGLSAGISPGPLLTLVISESLANGTKAGIKVAVAPILSDAPILAVSYYLAVEFSKTNILLGLISLFGALFLFYLGFQNFRYKESVYMDSIFSGKPVKKGILTNVLNPHPYIFWLSVGAPIMVAGFGESLFSGILFLAGFYLFLVGSKIALALLSGKIREFISSRSYLIILKILGLVLFVFGVLLLVESAGYLL